MLAGGLLAALALLALPLVSLRENRLAEGVPHGLGAAGGWALAVAGFAALALVAAFVARRRLRGLLALLDGTALVVSLAWALGSASRALLEAASPFARASVGAGTWLAVAGAAMLLFAGDDAYGDGAARPALGAALAVGIAGAVVLGGLDRISLAVEYEVQSRIFWEGMGGHVALSGGSLLSAAVIGVPLGTRAASAPAVRRGVLSVTGLIQTVPSLALLGLLIAPLALLSTTYPVLRQLGIRGIGFAPAFLALTLYGLLPIVRDTYLGLRGVDPGAVNAGKGMGMTPVQLLLRVRFPLALPLVLEGVRIAAVLVIGITTVTALVGARTLGTLVFNGLGQGAYDLTLLGALPVIALAVLADYSLRWLARAVTPRGVRA
ncbi:MAG: ABC transporter permease [Coriobacteriia bacterium]|nr:ABC transporter permease [Coriobacteriia bacterium]